MRIITHTCKNCYETYGYQASGEGCGRVENDGHYCPRCKLNILEALARIPKTAEWTRVDVEPESEEGQKVLAKMREDQKGTDGFCGLRMYPVPQHTFKTTDKGIRVANAYHSVWLEGARYTLIEDKLEGKPMQIEKNVLRSLLTGETFLPLGWEAQT